MTLKALKAVRRNDPITVQAKDSIGFVRKLAPSDGATWETAEECGFISEKELQELMVDLKMKQRNGNKSRR